MSLFVKTPRCALLSWEWQFWASLATAVGFGAEVRLLSWRDAYPWVTASLMLGPFAIGFDAIRPDAIALQMRRTRE